VIFPSVNANKFSYFSLISVKEKACLQYDETTAGESDGNEGEVDLGKRSAKRKLDEDFVSSQYELTSIQGPLRKF
jgi:hypothetical protein